LRDTHYPASGLARPQRAEVNRQKGTRQTFVAADEAGSFSAAARRLNVGQCGGGSAWLFQRNGKQISAGLMPSVARA